MLIAETIAILREQVSVWRRAGQRIAFVPTMGNLHAGHYSLIELARKNADRVMASIFVNPTQFGPNEDYSRYPRTPESDAEGLRAAGCDGLFLPSVQEMYPMGEKHCVQVRVPDLTEELDGAARPGHFDGVATVVLRLFNMVQPDVAVFGRKDYQQWRVIDYLTRELALPIRILPAPISRADDGLALSSRNQYLSAEERQQAPRLYQALQTAKAAWQAGTARQLIEDKAMQSLQEAGFAPDYVQIRRGVDLRAPSDEQRQGCVILAAARLGSTRLIDNLELDG